MRWESLERVSERTPGVRDMRTMASRLRVNRVAHRAECDLLVHVRRREPARRAARDPDWLADYRQLRPMVERAIAWLARGNRRVRCGGVVKSDHWLHQRAAALKLRRLIILGLAHDGTNWVIA